MIVRFALIISLALPFLLFAQSESELEAPTVSDVISCGADFLTLTATSDIRDDDLEFEWFDSNEQFLGSLNSPTGISQFITPYLIEDNFFFVRIRIGNATSDFSQINIEITHQASVIEGPEIELCTEGYLNADTNLEGSYQWQILVANEFGQSSFIDLTSPSSNLERLIIDQTGFYRVVITDNDGCQAISNEIEVVDHKIIEFRESLHTCYDSAILNDDVVTLENAWGREFTQYQWEFSLDGQDPFTVVGSEQSILIAKPTDEPIDTAYYRLTITEQNCVYDTIIEAYWHLNPNNRIKHVDENIGSNDFFFCETEPEESRKLYLEDLSPRVEANWYSLSYADGLTLNNIKTFFGPRLEGSTVEILEEFTDFLNPIGQGDTIVLSQSDTIPFDLDGGLIFAVLTDALTGCTSYSYNSLFADTAIPYPMLGSEVAYSYPINPASPSGFLTYQPVCMEDTLTIYSYDDTPQDYTWYKYDEILDKLIAIENEHNDTLLIIAEKDSIDGTYYLEVTKDGCTGLSEAFEVKSLPLPTVEITSVDDERAETCNGTSSVFLNSEGTGGGFYQWYYSPDGISFFPTGDEDVDQRSFYRARQTGYYVISISNGFCLGESDAVYVEIPDVPDPDFQEITISGPSAVCAGEEVVMTSSFESTTASYFWYYAFVNIDENTDVSTELVEFGPSPEPEISIATLPTDLDTVFTQPLILYVYGVAIDEECVVANSEEPHLVTITPVPDIELIFTDGMASDDSFICTGETVNEELQINDISAMSITGLSYSWERYNSETGSYDALDETGITITVTEPGSYRAIAETNDGLCQITSNDLSIQTLPSEIDGNTTQCFETDITISAKNEFTTDLDLFTYEWYRSDTNTDFAALSGETASSIVIDADSELFRTGFFYYTVAFQGCSIESDTLEITGFTTPPSIAVTNVEEDNIASCSQIPSILLFGSGSDNISEYQWFYSSDDTEYELAPGDNSTNFYQATSTGFYKLLASNGACSVSSDPDFVEIVTSSDPDQIDIALSGSQTYCEGEVIQLTSNYESSSASYQWFYEVVNSDGLLLDLGVTSSALSVNTEMFANGLSEPLELQFYMQALDNGCVIGSNATPYAITIDPSPDIALQFEGQPDSDEFIACGEAIDQELVVSNLSTQLNGLTYTWTQWNANTDQFDTLHDVSGVRFSTAETGTYKVIASTEDGSCFTESNSLELLTTPDLINGDVVYCFGDEIMLNASLSTFSNPSRYTFQWYISLDGTDFNPISSATSDTLTIASDSPDYGEAFFYYESTINECTTASETVHVTENTNSINSTLSVDVTQVKNIPFEATVAIESENENIEFSWQPSEYVSFLNETSAIFNFSELYDPDSVTISVMITDGNGCDVALSEVIFFTRSNDITFSKFITPNFDGINDYFEITGFDESLPNKLIITDSWGNRLYEKENYYNGLSDANNLMDKLTGSGIHYYLFEEENEVFKGSFYLKK